MSKSLIKGVNPVFTISDINVDDILNRYNQGLYNTVTLESIKGQAKPTKTTSIAGDQNAPVFVTIDNRGIRSCMVSANYKHINKCQWCRDTLTSEPIGLPIKLKGGVGNLEFRTEGCYCSFECAYADYIRSFINDPAYYNTESYLHNIFETIYPSKRLKPAPDWKLHECNGGALSSETFHSGSHQYYDSGRLKCIPSSRLYFRRNNVEQNR
jgi:hypothetical protein